MASLEDIVANYNEEEDPDYVPEQDAEGGAPRKRLAAGARAGAAQGPAKRPRIGQAVVSDDEGDGDGVADAARKREGEEKEDGDEADAEADALWAELKSGGGNGGSGAAAAATAPAAADASAVAGKADEQEKPGDEVDALWAEMQADGGGGGVGGSKVQLKEVVEYAGERIELVREVARGSAEERRLLAKQSDPRALEHELRRPKAINTVLKSRLDWEGDKAEKGDAHELAQFRKNGVVEAANFLHRVDVRQFERERALREQARLEQERQARRKEH